MAAESEEDRFVRILAWVESGNMPAIWGDTCLAVGRWQQHPSFYASWGPQPNEFHGKEHSWDWAFEQAVRYFFKRARIQWPEAQLRNIAMAYHLHGQLRLDGWDDAYAKRWTEMEAKYGST